MSQPSDHRRNSDPRARAIVFGGYGTFGKIVARELAERGLAVTVAGRDGSKANALAAELNDSTQSAAHAGLNVNVRDESACIAAIAGHVVAVNCAGPFKNFGKELPSACLHVGCHYVDIADDRSYCQMIRALDTSFAQRQLTAAYGCSSLPAISLAAAIKAAEMHGDHQHDASPQLARVSLFIGNNNPKGHGAVSSAAQLVGREILAPQATLYGFRDPETVPLPDPFGPRSVLNFESPDYDLLPQRLNVEAVRVKVGFELSLANWAFRVFAGVAPSLGRRALPLVGKAGGLLRGIGSSGGVVMSELFWPDDKTVRVAIVARENGQRLAALPAVYVAEALCDSSRQMTPGANTAVDVIGAQPLLDRLVADGYELVIESS